MAPAFDMYEILTTALGGRMVTVPLGQDFAFDPEAFAAAITPATKIAFLTNPHNPSGRFEPVRTFVDLARAIAPIILFLDEAYADFCEASAIDADLLASQPNLLVGRTFSKVLRARRPSRRRRHRGACVTRTAQEHRSALQPQCMGDRGPAGRARGRPVPLLVLRAGGDLTRADRRRLRQPGSRHLAERGKLRAGADRRSRDRRRRERLRREA